MAWDKPREIFLSHSSANRRFARKVAKTLVDHGLSVWFSERSILSSSQWHDEIGDALRRADSFGIILSPQACDSQWVKRELLSALGDGTFGDRFIPILYRPCDYLGKLSWVLDNFQIVDFKASHKEGFRNLLSIWGIGYKV